MGFHDYDIQKTENSVMLKLLLYLSTDFFQSQQRSLQYQKIRFLCIKNRHKARLVPVTCITGGPIEWTQFHSNRNHKVGFNATREVPKECNKVDKSTKGREETMPMN